MSKRRILICGGRDFTDINLFNHTIEQAEKFFDKLFVVISGGARGADRMAEQWASINGYPLIVMPAHWEVYSKTAGPIRNIWMLDWALPDLIIAFPGGRGTAHMIAKAMERGIDVYKVK